MKKIGIWLESVPYSGGVYQFTLTYVELISLVKKIIGQEIEIYAIVADKNWEKHILQNNTVLNYDKVLFFKYSLVDKIFRKILIHNILLIKLWRLINHLSLFSYSRIYKEKIDFILYPSQETLASELKINSISTIHDLMHLNENYPEVSEPGTIRSRNYQYKLICKYSKYILVNSQIGADHVKLAYQKYLTGTLIILPELPPPYIYHYKENKKLPSTQKKYKLPAKYFFYPAQFWAHKNHEVILDAIYYLKSKEINVKFVFAGSKKNNYENIINIIKNYSVADQIHILGYVTDDEMIDLYVNCYALVYSSQFGPSNIPLVEALFLGIPVITSNKYAMPQQVHGAGILFDPNNYRDLAEKLEMIWNNEKVRAEYSLLSYSLKEKIDYYSHALKLSSIV